MRVLSYGPQALLVECADASERRACQRTLEVSQLPQIDDLVPGERTVLVVMAEDTSAHQTRAALEALAPADPGPVDPLDQGRPIEIPVAYQGPDLDDTAAALQTTAQELIAWHTGQLWRCDFVGFMPGFGYLVPTDEARVVPRRNSPRTKVPAGAVGLAGHFSGIYPRVSPGGWQLIGRTAAQLWDASAPRPPLITSDALIRFRQVEQPAGETLSAGGSAPFRLGEPVFEVLQTGPLALLEDGGRPGFQHWGVSRGGAADRDSARLANRLVGNPEDAATVEVLVGGLSLRALASVEVVVGGAIGPITVNDRERSPLTPVRLGPGEVLNLAPAQFGLRRYLAVAGGLLAATELGSVGASPALGLGPPALQVGQILSRGVPGQPPMGVDWGVTQAILPGGRVLRIWPGPRRDWFSDSAWDLLLRGPWTVTSDSDRVGIRLAGDRLERIHQGELPSEPMVAGAIQVPPSGEPVIFGVDHPTTGGYPVIAVVDPGDLSALAQSGPGSVVGFRTASRGT